MHHLKGLDGFIGEFASSDLGSALLHGAVGGLSSDLSGGAFGAGFLAGGFSDFAGPLIKIGSSDIANTFKRAILGGVGSVLGGGKFTNGAITGAFGYLFNKALVGTHEFTVGGVYFRVYNATRRFSMKIKSAIETTYSTLREKKMLLAMIENFTAKGDAVIIQVLYGENAVSGVTKASNVLNLAAVEINTSIFKTKYGTERMTLLRFFAHEFGHMAFGDNDAYDPSMPDRKDNRMLNINRNENPVMTHLGFPARDRYEFCKPETPC